MRSDGEVHVHMLKNNYNNSSHEQPLQNTTAQHKKSHHARATIEEEASQALPRIKAERMTPTNNAHHTHTQHCPYTSQTSHYTSVRQLLLCYGDATQNLAYKIQVRSSQIHIKSSSTNASMPIRVHAAVLSKSNLTSSSPPALGSVPLHLQHTHSPCTPPTNNNTSHQIHAQIHKSALEHSVLLPAQYTLETHRPDVRTHYLKTTRQLAPRHLYNTPITAKRLNTHQLQKHRCQSMNITILAKAPYQTPCAITTPLATQHTEQTLPLQPCL
jgi:hypothetical protein